MSVIAPSSSVQNAAVDDSSLRERFILVQVQSFSLVIPAAWVAEIFRIERPQILSLPFYSPVLVGITHHGGRVLPLLSAHHLLKTDPPSLRETVMVVKLNDAAETLAHVGLVVDRTLGSQTRAELPPAIFADASNAMSEPIVLLPTTGVPSDLWQPLCWLPDSSF